MMQPIILRKPSSDSNGVTHTCQMVAACKENQAFAAIRVLRKFETDHSTIKPFNRSSFTLEEDGEGRWVHRPKSNTKSSVSDHFRFELVNRLTGVRPTSSPTAL